MNAATRVDQVPRGPAGIAVLLLGLGHQEQGMRPSLASRTWCAPPGARRERELLVVSAVMARSRFLIAYGPGAWPPRPSPDSAPPEAGNGLVTPCTKAMLCLSTVSELVPTLPCTPPPRRLADLDRVATGGRHPALAAVAEGDLALDGVARVVAHAGSDSKKFSTWCQRTQGAVAVLVGWTDRPLPPARYLALRGRRRVGSRTHSSGRPGTARSPP